MKYPVSHSKRFEEIEEIVTSWPVEKEFDHVLKWLMQFDTDDIELGIRIIKSLNVIGFEDLNSSLSIAYSKLERVAIDRKAKISNKNTLFAGIGDGAKSGAMIGYNFKIVNELSEENFMTDESIDIMESGLVENIVLVDDVIGTGDQAKKEIRLLTDKVTPFGVKNIFLITAVGMAEGIKRIISETKAHVFSAFEYSELDTAANLDSGFYESVPHELRGKFRSRLEYYGKVSNKSGLGYGGIGALIAFYYNTPNISLPVIWGSANSWIPLFRRAVKINGINSYYKQIESPLNKMKKFTAAHKDSKEMFIFVEGRFDESFFEFVISDMKIPVFEKISVVSLGGYHSKKLLENIVKISPNSIFIIEDEKSDPRKQNERLVGLIGEGKCLIVQPTESFFDLEKMKSDDHWGKFFKQETPEKKERPYFIRDPLREILRRISGQTQVSFDFYRAFVSSTLLKDLREAILEKIGETKVK